MKRNATSSFTTMRMAAIALCLAMGAALLSACSGQPASSASASSAAQSASSSAAASIDVSSWKTLGDAIAAQTDSMSAGWNDEYYVSVFRAGDSIIRVVAKSDASARDRIDAIDWSQENVTEQLAEAAGALPLVSAEDLTGELVSQEELDKLAGKTGKELVDNGWAFEAYVMYGGKQTGATLVKGSLSYMFTFDVSINEADIEDGGASIMDAPTVEAQFMNAADAATDPTAIAES